MVDNIVFDSIKVYEGHIEGVTVRTPILSYRLFMPIFVIFCIMNLFTNKALSYQELNKEILFFPEYKSTR